MKRRRGLTAPRDPEGRSCPTSPVFFWLSLASWPDDKRSTCHWRTQHRPISPPADAGPHHVLRGLPSRSGAVPRLFAGRGHSSLRPRSPCCHVLNPISEYQFSHSMKLKPKPCGSHPNTLRWNRASGLPCYALAEGAVVCSCSCSFRYRANQPHGRNKFHMPYHTIVASAHYLLHHYPQNIGIKPSPLPAIVSPGAPIPRRLSPVVPQQWPPILRTETKLPWLMPLQLRRNRRSKAHPSTIPSPALSSKGPRMSLTQNSTPSVISQTPSPSPPSWSSP